ncbi:MAG TPA: ACP S-malonyltransferase [Chitinivibrionales bacterium]|nr:ACP S-malonyltransferase [Chitinivibrionales bacterium]
MRYTFLFPGQGSQKVGMGRTFFDSSEAARRRFDECNQVLGHDLVKVIFNGPEDLLTQTQNTQPALFTVEAIICDTLKEKGIVPSLAAGHSLGEYGALYAAGVFSFRDGLAIVAKRGALMAAAGQKTPGAMAAIVGLDKKKIHDAITGVGGTVVCANENSPEQTVISGEIPAVTKACEACKAAGAKRAVMLPVSGAFHSPLMAPSAEEFAAFIGPVAFSDAACPVIANVTAKPETSGAAIKKLLVKQLTSPVKWVDSVAFVSESDHGTLCETGPGTVLAGLVKKCNPALNVVPCGTIENIFSLVR